MNFFLTFIFFALYSNAFASYPELFGSSFSTSAIGNQSTLDSNDPSNNYYSPAILGFSNKVNALMQISSTATTFKTMSNITISNSSNSSSASKTGNVENAYPKFYGGAIHLALPIGYQHLGTLGISLFLPVGHLMETNTGNPFLPEYIMYHSRYRRTSFYINFARKWNDNLSFSLGTILGYQASADVKTNLSLSGADYGSWGQARSKISPSLGIIASVAGQFDKTKLYFTYQQEMKSNLHADVSGEVNNPSLLIFESGIDSMIFYDPHTFRFGSAYNFGIAELYAGVEYLMWSAYKPPTIFISKTGGVIDPSSNFEHLKVKNTINPRLGLNVDIGERWTTSLGAGYRMSPLEGDFSGSGNSIDSNTYILSSGLQYRIVIWSKDVILGTSLEYQELESKHVTKTAKQENGTAGLKIGAGGYDISGHIISAALGLKFNF